MKTRVGREISGAIENKRIRLAGRTRRTRMRGTIEEAMMTRYPRKIKERRKRGRYKKLSGTKKIRKTMKTLRGSTSIVGKIRRG